jgi:predicted hydrocarbon binding protein
MGNKISEVIGYRDSKTNEGERTGAFIVIFYENNTATAILYEDGSDYVSNYSRTRALEECTFYMTKRWGKMSYEDIQQTTGIKFNS